MCVLKQHTQLPNLTGRQRDPQTQSCEFLTKMVTRQVKTIIYAGFFVFYLTYVILGISLVVSKICNTENYSVHSRYCLRNIFKASVAILFILWSLLSVVLVRYLDNKKTLIISYSIFQKISILKLHNSVNSLFILIKRKQTCFSMALSFLFTQLT